MLALDEATGASGPGPSCPKHLLQSLRSEGFRISGTALWEALFQKAGLVVWNGGCMLASTRKKKLERWVCVSLRTLRPQL